MLGAEALAVMLAEYGATHFFHVPVIVPHALKKMLEVGMTPVVTHGEKAAAYMADGYARLSGRPGLCGAQAVGGTNLAAGLRDAYLGRVPIIALTGGPEPKTSYKNAYQEIDDMPIFDRLTKFNAVVGRGERLPEFVRQAYRAATTGTPRPVHLELPGLFGVVAYEDVKDDDVFVEPRYAQAPALRPRADSRAVAEAAKVLSTATRPLVLVGGGVKRSRAEGETVRFLERLELPAVGSLNGLGVLPEEHDLWVGVVGDYSRENANEELTDADVVLVLGSSLGSMTTRNYTVPIQGTPIVHVDIDAEETGRNYPNSVPLVGDIAAVLTQLDRELEPVGRPEWLARVARLKRDYRSRAQDIETSTDLPMRPERLWRALSEALPRHAVVVGDTGHVGAWSARHLHLDGTQTLIRAAGSLGWGLPAALGAKCAAPDRPVICLTGDAGLYYHIAELETARRYGINVAVVVNNNSGMNQEAHLWERGTAEDRNWQFEHVDFAAVAESFGCLGRVVESGDELAKALDDALEAGRPAVIDARTDPEIAAPTTPYTGN